MIDHLGLGVDPFELANCAVGCHDHAKVWALVVQFFEKIEEFFSVLLNYLFSVVEAQKEQISFTGNLPNFRQFFILLSIKETYEICNHRVSRTMLLLKVSLGLPISFVEGN